MHIKNRDKLFSALAYQLSHMGRDPKIGSICVTFFEGGKRVFESDLVTALRYLAEDIYWDEQGDWSDADSVNVSQV